MPWWLTLLLFVASYVLQALLVKNNTPKPASLEDFDFPQFEEGTPRAVIFGEGWPDGWFVLGFWNLRTEKIIAGGKK